jgi:tripartite-type tricarboxylate transporter receptor subunit TctC
VALRSYVRRKARKDLLPEPADEQVGEYTREQLTCRAKLCPGRNEIRTRRGRERLTAVLSRLFLLACMLGSPAALGQTYPERNVTIVVTSAAGALTDTLTRTIAQQLSEMWKQSVIVENRGGAGYSIAAQSVMRAEHDGYTLLASETGFYTTQPHLYAKGKLAYDAEKDFVPVAGYGTIPTALLVNPSVPVNSVSDLIAFAKKNPGAVTFGTAGVGTALHIAALELENLTGIKVTAAHYRGAAPALGDVIAGHINAVIMGPSVALSAVEAGKLKMLAFGSEKRLPQFPDIPTIAETVPGYEASVSFGLFVTAGTPADIIKKINADVQKIVSDPEFRKNYLERFALQPVPGPLDDFAEYLRKDSAKWGEVINAANVKIE